MNQYKKLFSLEKNLYIDGSPLLLEAGVLFSNVESGCAHIQLKFKNLSNVAISMVKVGFILMDCIGREIGHSEKQYIDLKANPNKSFGDRDPAYLSDNTIRKFSVIIEEICFANGTIWTAPQDALLEKIPVAKPITEKLTEKEALEEFKIACCKQAKFVPFSYKDLWMCSCGNINKSSEENCCTCGERFSKMDSIDSETLKKNNIYRNATALVNKDVSSEIQKGIALFEKIIDWMDSKQKLEKAKQRIVEVKKVEQEMQERNEKRRKKNIIISSITCAMVLALIIISCIVSSISKANKYEKAQDLMAENSLSAYGEAMNLLDDLEDYKDAEELYLRASYMYYGNYKEIIETDELTEFIIPEGTIKIADYAFKDCNSLTSVIIPDSVISIDDGAFYNCSSLTDIYINDIVAWCNISGLDDLMWYGSSNKNLYLDNELITELVIPDSVTVIPDCAFSLYSSLTSVVIPDSVTSIGEWAFYGCRSLTSVVIPDSVTSTGEYAFYDCSSLTSMTIPFVGAKKDGTSYTHFGYLFGASSSNENYKYVPSSLTTVVITGGKSIGKEAFKNCRSLTSVVIPDSVTRIGRYAFSGCSSLTSVTISYSVTSIGSSAFSGCSSLTSVTISYSVTSIGSSAFSSCGNLTSITFNGTKAQWKVIKKGGWNTDSAIKTVVCTDGTVSV